MLDIDYFFIMKTMLDCGIHPSRVLKKTKPKRKVCLLPGCGKITYHNGGYCSAEHCKEHKLLTKQYRRRH